MRVSLLIELKDPGWDASAIIIRDKKPPALLTAAQPDLATLMLEVTKALVSVAPQSAIVLPHVDPLFNQS